MTTTVAPPVGGAARSRPLPWWDTWFHVSVRGSTLKTEIVGGFATFLSMSYILFVNPSILGSVSDSAGTQLQFGQVLTVTALVGGVMTILMGAWGRFPAAIASGMGLNAFVAFGLVAGEQLSWADAMGVVVAEGLVIAVLVLTGFRQAIFNAIPADLKRAISVAIGFFIAVIGLVNAGIVIRGEGTIVAMNADLTTWNMVVFLAGLGLTAILMSRHILGGLLYGIIASTVLATIINEANDGSIWANGIASWPDKLVSSPNFNLVGNFSFDFVEALGFGTAAALVLAVMLSDFFDTAGTVAGIGEKADLLDSEGHVPHQGSVLFVDSVAAAAGGAASASSNTTFIESAAGVTEGARTGIASVVTGLAFLACLFISPLAGMVPAEATAPALVVVGVYMMSLIKEIEWDDYAMAIPAGLTIILVPFTYNIAIGIGAGFVSFTAIALFDGKRRRALHPLMFTVAAIFVWYFTYGKFA